MSYLVDSNIRVDVRLGDIGYAMEGWDTADIGRFVGVLLFGVNSFRARDFLEESGGPATVFGPASVQQLITGLYEYANELAQQSSPPP